MQENNLNFILAIALSIAVLVLWQVFFAAPKIDKEQQARREGQTTQQTQQPQPGAPQPPGVQPRPGSTAPTPPAPPQRDTVIASSQRVPIDTPSIKGSLALKGARIDDVVLKKYRETVDRQSPPMVLLSPAGTPGAYYAEHGWVTDAGAPIKVPGPDTEWKASSQGALTPGVPLTLTWDNGEGLVFKRIVSIDQNYMFTIRQEVENRTNALVTLHAYGLVSRHGKPKVESIYILHEGLVGVLGDQGLQEVDYEDVTESKNLTYKQTKTGWLGITDKYWAAVVVPNQQTAYQGRFTGSEEGTQQRFQADYLTGGIPVPAGGTASIEGFLFAGAKETGLVDAYAEQHGIAKFDLLIDWGWFYFLTKPLFFALDYFFRLVGNFGLSILIVTVLIKLVLFPLANKSYVSMSRMKKLQPEMERIKERFANDKVRQQQALMELYRQEKVNPAAGCLPILIQIPVFFALYKVLYVTIEMRHAPFYGWIKDLSAPDPTTIFNLFGLIPWTPPDFLHVGVWPLIMGVTMWLQMQLNPQPPDPMQAKIFKWMPVFFTFILAPFPAGLVIYWAWNNTLSLIQQWFIMSRQGVEVALWENLGFKNNDKKRARGQTKT